MSETILFGYWRSSATYRTRIALNLKGVSYRTVGVHLLKDEQVQPAHLADEMEGFLNTWREAGYVPQWPHPNGGGMAGTMSDVTFSEAVAKLPHCGSARAAAAGYCVNASALYAASRENAFGRNSEYYTLGYIPYEAGGTMVSDTLLNYHADWAVSQAAAALGFADDAAILLARANNFTKQLDPARGFMVPRLRNGSFVADFDEFAWGQVSRGTCRSAGAGRGLGFGSVRGRPHIAAAG